MLLVKLSSKFKITVTTIMWYDEENGRIKTITKLRAKDREGKVTEINCNGKRGLVVEMMGLEGNGNDCSV